MSRIHARSTSVRRNQAGLVSIMVTMVLMIVISLIVLGFAQISRRNQRQQLDRQLSTQAFYAAETGVNDARDLILKALATGATPAAKPDCQSTGSGFYSGLNPVLNAADNVSYTCLTVDPNPTTLQYSDIGATSAILPVQSATGDVLSTIKLTWQTKDNTSTPVNGCPTSATSAFSDAATWTASNCGYGVLRFDLVPTTGVLSSSSLLSSTMTTFAVPLRSGGTNAVGYAGGATNGNNRVGVACSNSNCTLTITGLSKTQYYMRISSIYKDVSLQVNATNAAAGTVKLEGAQAVIDSTGKAQDVLRRIQVHVPLQSVSKNSLPDYALESTDAICKRFAVYDGYFNNQVSGVTSTNPLCQP